MPLITDSTYRFYYKIMTNAAKKIEYILMILHLKNET